MELNKCKILWVDELYRGEVRVPCTNSGPEMLLHESILYLFLRSLNFSIGNKPSNLETLPVSSFGSKSNKFKECKTHLLGKALSKNQNKMGKGAFLAAFPQFLLLIQTAFAGCTLDNWIMSLNFSIVHQFIFCNSTGSDWKPKS